MLKLSKSSQLIIITDVDGTLIDQRTYSYELSLPAVRRLQANRIPIILCSTKTSAEILLLWHELELDDPFICENGGAIHMPAGYFGQGLPRLKTDGPFEVLELGSDVDRLRQALVDTARACGVLVRCFGQMQSDEITALTGLSADQAVRALRRRYDEPFLVRSGDESRLIAILRAKNLTVTKGDRFYHLSGGHSKREAVETLLKLYRDQNGHAVSICLGNSANDAPMLAAVDRPILVKNPDGSWDATVTEAIPNIERTIGVGPEGWREAIDGILDEATP